MALRNQPYLPLYIKDFMTHEKLNECSAEANGVYIRIMCLMHKSEVYGQIKLKAKYEQKESKIRGFALQLSKQMPFETDIIDTCVSELVHEKVLFFDGNFLCQKRMIKDGRLSDVRAKAGSKKSKSKSPSKTGAKTVNEDESKSDSKIIKKDKIPTLTEFLDHGKILCEKAGLVYKNMIFSIEQKYHAWVSLGWKDGHDKPIQVWKTKLGNTLPHLKPISNQSNDSIKADFQRVDDQLTGSKLSQGDGQ